MCSLEMCRDTSRRGTHAERLGEEELGTSRETAIGGQLLSSRSRQAPLRFDAVTAEGPRGQWPVGLSIHVSALIVKHTTGFPRGLLDPQACCATSGQLLRTGSRAAEPGWTCCRSARAGWRGDEIVHLLSVEQLFCPSCPEDMTGSLLQATRGE